MSISRLLLSLFCALACQASAAGDHALTSEELMQTAIAEYDRGDYADAEEDFSEFIRRNPEDPGAYFNRALTRQRLGKTADAETDLDVYLSWEPKAANGFELRALIRLQRGNIAGALADANIGLRLEDGPGLRSARGRALLAKGDCEAAIKDLDIALEANESDDDARFARGDCYLNLGRLEEACADFSVVADRHPDAVHVFEKLGDARFRSLDFEGAVAALEQVASVEATRTRGLRKIGYGHYGRGHYEDAVVSLNLSVDSERAPSPWAVAMLHLAAQRTKRPGESPLPTVIGRVEDAWGKAVCQMLLKQISEDELIEKANSGEDQNARAGWLCEAYFYIGSARLLAGDKIAARAMFAQAVATERKTFIEYTLARAELARP